MSSQPPRIVHVAPDEVRNALLVVAALLVALDFCMAVLHYGFGHDTVFGLVRFLELDAERTLPACYNALLLLGAAVCCWLIAWFRAPHPRSWSLLGLIFAFLTVDEWASVHERLAIPVREALGTSGLLYTAWIIPYVAAAVVLFVALVPWLRDLPPRIRRGLLVAAGVYVGGAVVMEAISGAYRSAKGFENQFDFTYDILSATEESLEMLGVILFIHCTLRYAGMLSQGVRIIPEPPGEGPAELPSAAAAERARGKAEPA